MSPIMRMPVRLLAARPVAPISRVIASRMASGSAVHGLDPKVLSEEKSKNLKGKQDSSAPLKEHAPGWNEKLASDSEAAIKADDAAPSKPTEELQKKTVEQVHEHHGQKK